MLCSRILGGRTANLRTRLWTRYSPVTQAIATASVPVSTVLCCAYEFGYRDHINGRLKIHSRMSRKAPARPVQQITSGMRWGLGRWLFVLLHWADYCTALALQLHWRQFHCIEIFEGLRVYVLVQYNYRQSEVRVYSILLYQKATRVLLPVEFTLVEWNQWCCPQRSSTSGVYLL